MKTLKKLISTIVLSAAAFSAISCGDEFLNVENPTAAPIKDYYTTVPHLTEALVAAYCPLHWTDWSMGEYNPVLLMSDIMADQLWVGGNDATDNANWHKMMNYIAEPTACIKALWTDAYSGVKRCNDVIEYVEWVPGLSTEIHDSYVAQALVLRSFYYNWLWKFWGNVVYYDKNLQEPYLADQFTADEIYAKNITSLENAIKMDVLPMVRPDAEVGYVTKAMAYMLYAEMVMYQKDTERYATALSYMEEIIESENYSLYGDVTKLFKVDGEWCSESIFEVAYKVEGQERSYDNVLAAGGTILPQLIGPYNLSGNTDNHAAGWGFGPVRKETYDLFAASDKRRAATCYNASGNKYDKRYQDTGYFLEKYQGTMDDQNAGDFGANHMRYGNNLRIYRYAETLLNAAELALTSKPAKAKEWLNLVHNRSGLTDTVEATLDNIQKERQLEFVGEGKRYWDLIRWDLAETVLVPDTYGYRTNAWTPSKKYLPIPQSEIDAAQKTLKQNNY